MSYTPEMLNKLYILAVAEDKASTARAKAYREVGDNITEEDLFKLPDFLSAQEAIAMLVEHLRKFEYDDLLKIAAMSHMGFDRNCCKRKDDDIYNAAIEFVTDHIVFHPSQNKKNSPKERLVKHLSDSWNITKYLYDYFETRCENPFKNLV